MISTAIGHEVWCCAPKPMPHVTKARILRLYPGDDAAVCLVEGMHGIAQGLRWWVRSTTMRDSAAASAKLQLSDVIQRRA